MKYFNAVLKCSIWVSVGLLKGQRTAYIFHLLQMETVDKLIMLKSFEFPRFNVAVFLSGLGLWVLSHCPERHGVVWWDVGLGWLLIINGTFLPVAALPRPTETWRLGDLNSFVLLVFFLCMSHVVGEVTYVELFKDAEGKSRVSDVAICCTRF